MVLYVISAPIRPIFSDQENTTFELVSLAIVFCSFLSMGLIIIPERDGQMVKSLTDSLVSCKEEERHQKNLNENEQLKKQITEIEGKRDEA
ncbi:hypothetical protein RRG08_053469 [Elysia crispata]|uniref:Uncharacterized protein n=1 Tax=Elysia crispata TaxID=231223 RepID=A0AAE0XNH2_9GAST|nr:hypothetical protein RRG08_053469 [Elysia crispata]